MGVAGMWVSRKLSEPAPAGTTLERAKGPGPAKVPAPTRSAASFDPPVRAALAHLGIEQVGEDVTSPAYNLRVSKDAMTMKDLEELDESTNGWTKFKDFAQLPEKVAVWCVTIQQGFSDNTVWVTENGRILLVKFTPEG